jgi:hypothetical protein
LDPELDPDPLVRGTDLDPHQNACNYHITGPGGQRIRKIRNYSKASIVIEEPQAGNTERLITIEGTEGQISIAKNLLKQAVSENRAMQQANYGPVPY